MVRTRYNDYFLGWANIFDKFYKKTISPKTQKIGFSKLGFSKLGKNFLRTFFEKTDLREWHLFF